MMIMMIWYGPLLRDSWRMGGLGGYLLLRCLREVIVRVHFLEGEMACANCFCYSSPLLLPLRHRRPAFFSSMLILARRGGQEGLKLQ
jgi:hypothetical protein